MLCVHACMSVCVSACGHVYSITQSCLTLWNPMDCSPQGFSVHGIFKVRILQQVTISYSRGFSSETWPASLRPLALAGRFCITAPPGKLLSDAAYAGKSLQTCLTLCDPTDGGSRGSPVPGILQARTLEWVAMSFSNAWKGKVKVKMLSRVWLFATPWTIQSLEFSRPE